MCASAVQKQLACWKGHPWPFRKAAFPWNGLCARSVLRGVAKRLMWERKKQVLGPFPIGHLAYLEKSQRCSTGLKKWMTFCVLNDVNLAKKAGSLQLITELRMLHGCRSTKDSSRTCWQHAKPLMSSKFRTRSSPWRRNIWFSWWISCLIQFAIFYLCAHLWYRWLQTLKGKSVLKGWGPSSSHRCLRTSILRSMLRPSISVMLPWARSEEWCVDFCRRADTVVTIVGNANRRHNNSIVFKSIPSSSVLKLSTRPAGDTPKNSTCIVRTFAPREKQQQREKAEREDFRNVVSSTPLMKMTRLAD